MIEQVLSVGNAPWDLVVSYNTKNIQHKGGINNTITVFVCKYECQILYLRLECCICAWSFTFLRWNQNFLPINLYNDVKQEGIGESRDEEVDEFGV